MGQRPGLRRQAAGNVLAGGGGCGGDTENCLRERFGRTAAAAAAFSDRGRTDGDDAADKHCRSAKNNCAGGGGDGGGQASSVQVGMDFVMKTTVLAQTALDRCHLRTAAAAAYGGG